mmetsp:Transcript_10787/g.16034  ORF Transcript_10787/g.16034 Transcript_10787/m.16034 type:complete len:310 (-) Transcript_10787:251-1180(-)
MQSLNLALIALTSAVYMLHMHQTLAFTLQPTPGVAGRVQHVNVGVNKATFLTTVSNYQLKRHNKVASVLLWAGGFEYNEEDAQYDDIENPFKKDDSYDGDTGELKVDPARLLGPRLKGSSLYLVGMMGSGKSSVGNVLAKRMGSYNFLDTDTIIENATGMSIPAIFEAEGEEGFRDVEAQVLDSVQAYVRCVVSTGGGIVCRQMNWSKLQTGIVAWLNVEPEVIMSRIEGTDRPLLQTEDPLATLKGLLEERTSKYGQADVEIKVTADMDENAVVDALVKEIHEFIDNNPPAWKQAKEKAQSEGLDWVK